MPTTRMLPALEPTTLAYIAGFIDGEGTITLRRASRGRKARPREEYGEFVAVAQKDRAILDWLKATLDCGAVVEHKAPRAFGYEVRQMHHWSVQYNLAGQICQALLPFLKVKRQQAEIVLAFQATKAEWQTRKRIKGRRGTLSTPPDVLDRYRSWVVEIQALNGRKPKTENP